MYACMHACMYVYCLCLCKLYLMKIHNLDICLHTYVYRRIEWYAHIEIHRCIYIHSCKYTHTHLLTQLFIHTYINNTFSHIHTYIYSKPNDSHTHTHMHACSCRWTGSFLDSDSERKYISQSLDKIKTEAQTHVFITQILLVVMCASMHSLGENKGWKASVWPVRAIRVMCSMCVCVRVYVM